MAKNRSKIASKHYPKSLWLLLEKRKGQCRLDIESSCFAHRFDVSL
jgi:hypothetical protein